MKNKIIAITGASSGLGRALSLLFAKEGTKLSLFARDEARLHAVAEECADVAGANSEPLVTAGDVREAGECKKWMESTVAHFGGVDCLINNAGLSMKSKAADCADITAFRPVMDTVFWGAAYCAHSALPHLRASRGIVVNISSVQGKTAIPLHSVYSAGKHALEGFFSSLAMEEPGIHFLSVRPSWIDGTHINENRIGGESAQSAKQNGGGLDLNDCAQKIVKATEQRRKVLTIPAHYKWLPLLSEVFPAVVQKAILHKTNFRYNN